MPIPLPQVLLSDPLTLVLLGAIITIGLILVGAVVTAWVGRQETEQLESLLAPGEEERRALEESRRAVREERWEGLNKQLERTAWWENLRWGLSRAGLRLTPTEYIALRILAVILGTLLGYALGGRSLLFTLLGLVVGLFGFGWYIKFLQRRRLKQFNDQLVDTLNLLINSLRAGFSLPQALDAVAKEMPPPVSEEFRRVVQEIQIGIPLDQALDNLVKRMPSEDLDLVVTAMKIQREVGGPLTEILENAVHTIRERIRIQGEISALTAQVRYSGIILSLMPICLFLIIYRIAPDYAGQFLQNGLCGYSMLGLGLMLIGIGYFAMQRIAQIEV